MLTGYLQKTQNYTVSVYWPTEGDKRDFSFQHEIGSWLVKNAKVLDKKTGPEAIRIIRDQFPGLHLIELRDFANRLARWAP